MPTHILEDERDWLKSYRHQHLPLMKNSFLIYYGEAVDRLSISFVLPYSFWGGGGWERAGSQSN